MQQHDSTACNFMIFQCFDCNPLSRHTNTWYGVGLLTSISMENCRSFSCSQQSVFGSEALIRSCSARLIFISLLNPFICKLFIRFPAFSLNFDQSHVNPMFTWIPVHECMIYSGVVELNTQIRVPADCNQVSHPFADAHQRFH